MRDSVMACAADFSVTALEEVFGNWLITWTTTTTTTTTNNNTPAAATATTSTTTTILTSLLHGAESFLSS